MNIGEKLIAESYAKIYLEQTKTQYKRVPLTKITSPKGKDIIRVVENYFWVIES